jgi:hypothetical protein
VGRGVNPAHDCHAPAGNSLGHQLHPPVLGAPHFALVGDHRRSPGLGQLDVVIEGTDVVSVADHVELELGIGLEHLGDLVDGRLRPRADLGLSCVEINPVNSGLSGFIKF